MSTKTPKANFAASDHCETNHQQQTPVGSTSSRPPNLEQLAPDQAQQTEPSACTDTTTQGPDIATPIDDTSTTVNNIATAPSIHNPHQNSLTSTPASARLRDAPKFIDLSQTVPKVPTFLPPPLKKTANASSNSRKRGAEEEAPETPQSRGTQQRHTKSQTPSSEPLLKKARLQARPSHNLDRFTFNRPWINTQEPPSPLFFSHSSRLRPQLPPRLSSSEAGATMLSSAKSEDRHIKRVTLARGTLPAPSFPTSAPMRQSLERSSTQDSTSSDRSGNKDSSPAALASIGITELLEQDERPTLIVDVGEPSNYGLGPLQPIFANAALRSQAGLLDIVSGTVKDGSPSSFLSFKSWVLGSVVNGECLNVRLPPHSFAGISWQSSTLRKRLRVLNGSLPFDPVQSTPTDASVASIQSAPSALPSETSAQPLTSIHLEEPQDYFGAAAQPMPPHSGFSSVPSGDVLPSKEDIYGQQDAVQQLMKQDREMSFPLSTPADFVEAPSFDWTRLPVTDSMPQHVQFARSIDWGQTALGPIETWNADLRQMCNLIMASPHPAAMYWGEELIAIYNEAYILLAGQKHPKLMGQSYKVAWVEIWPEVEGVFASAVETGEATMKDDDRLFMLRNSFLEETYFSWSIIPLVGGDGRVKGLYNPAFEKTRRKLAERRMLTLREIGERTASARDVKAFWGQVLCALESNEYDTPFVLLYSVVEEVDSDASSMYSGSPPGSQQCILEGILGVPEGHRSAPTSIDLKTGGEGFGPVFREVAKTIKPVLLEVGSRDLPAELVEGLDSRGFGDPCRGVVVCPIHPTTGDSILGFLVIGVNPRRPYDEDYSLFVQLLNRQLATSLASVVLFEEEIRRGQKAAKLAALDRLELSEQLAARTQEAIESETKFTRMAEFAPVGMFIANPEGKITYCNNTFFDISRVDGSRDENKPDVHWMDAVRDEDRPLVQGLWRDLIVKKEPQTGSFRFKAPYQDDHGTAGERWVLFSAYPEKYESGALKSVFGSLTDISKQKWAEDFQKRKMEEAVELKKSLERFVDMTSHEMRNPLSAILQCADDIANTMSEYQTNMAAKSGGTTSIMPDGHKDEESPEDVVASAIDSAQTITLCAQHQKRIVDDILTLSKLDSQLLLVTPVDAQPVTVAERALKMHEGELQTADIRLKFIVDESYRALGVDWVRMDPSRTLQVLINLTTNAIKFTTTESKRTIIVTIAASKERPSESEKRIVDYFPTRKKSGELSEDKDWGDGEEVYIHFAVQDTGRGLDEKEKKMLFLRFSQASPRTHVQYGGSGLGLFISRELTELQGGEIGVASEAGVGSTFAFYVKARRSSAPKDDLTLTQTRSGTSVKARSNHHAATSEGNKKLGGNSGIVKDEVPIRVLIVEDNLVNQRVMSKQLRNLGCIVHTANHGGEALEILAKSTYWNHGPDSTISPADRIELSIVLMDQEMPVMDGLTCTKKIRELERNGKFVKHVPIIAVTANARSEQIDTAMSAGMDAVQPKPFRIPELMERMRELRTKMGIE